MIILIRLAKGTLENPAALLPIGPENRPALAAVRQPYCATVIARRRLR